MLLRFGLRAARRTLDAGTPAVVRREERWLGRFLDPLPVSAEGAFRITAARDAVSGRECVVVTGSPLARVDGVRAALAALHDAHARIAHPIVAPVLARGDEGDWVALDVPARTDLAGLLMLARAREISIEHGAADGFITSLRDGLFAAFATQDAAGRPLSLGAIAYGNVLFAPDGRFWIVGFGHNVIVADESGRMGGRGTAFQAPEVAIGAPPTRSSEFVALLHFMRALVPFMRLRPAIVRVLAGNSLREDFELIGKLVWFERRVLTALPETRASIDQAIATSDRIRDLLGVRPDPDAFRRAIGVILEEEGRLLVGAAQVSWRVAVDGSRIERIGLPPLVVPGRGALRRIVLALVRARIERPGASLTLSDLASAGWPGERMLARAARNRVHVAVSTLRKLGLGHDVESSAGAYRINPAIVIAMVDAEAAASSTARP